MIVHDTGQTRAAPRTPRHPARKLVIPHAVMTTKYLTIALCEGSNLVGLGESETILGGLGRVPLPTIGGRDLAEHVLVFKDRNIGGV